MTQEGPDNGGERAPVPSAATEGLPEGLLAPSQVLGDRYQIKSQLGRGGMGEVWRAFDLKLRVEVALKAMLPDLFKDERRRDLLRREVRAAREVVSPNVCRIFDLIEVDGAELVSMEYVDGGTLLELLAQGGPLDLKEAQDIASQFLAGLEAIHQAGLVHRDVKPENIMITRAGRVVLMDFGLARQEDSGAGTVSGTPAYMAPEQAAGLKVDARADVYSAGVVLAEMVSPDGIKDFESRQSVWEGIRQEPARVPDSPRRRWPRNPTSVTTQRTR
jgi:serine/threonine-protein kinase